MYYCKQSDGDIPVFSTKKHILVSNTKTSTVTLYDLPETCDNFILINEKEFIRLKFRISKTGTLFIGTEDPEDPIKTFGIINFISHFINPMDEFLDILKKLVEYNKLDSREFVDYIFSSLNEVSSCISSHEESIRDLELMQEIYTTMLKEVSSVSDTFALEIEVEKTKGGYDG